MRFAVGQATPDTCAHTWRILGIDRVYIEADMQPVSLPGGKFDGLLHDRGQAQAINLLHSEDVHSNFAQESLFAGIKVARTNNNHARWIDFAANTAQLHQPFITNTYQGCQGHTMNIATGRRFRRIEISMGINPYHAHGSARLDYSGDRSQRDAMVSTDYQREIVRPAVTFDRSRQVLAHIHNRLQVTQARFVHMLLLDFERRDNKIPLIYEIMTKPA